MRDQLHAVSLYIITIIKTAAARRPPLSPSPPPPLTSLGLPTPDACKQSYYDAAASKATDDGGGPQCEPCPTEGVDCVDSGITIKNLPIQEAYWRYSLTTDQVFACDHPRACKGSNTTAAGNMNFGDGLCAEKYEGVLCE